MNGLLKIFVFIVNTWSNRRDLCIFNIRYFCCLKCFFFFEIKHKIFKRDSTFSKYLFEAYCGFYF